jgi:uncharacterized cupin superfamily protein
MKEYTNIKADDFCCVGAVLETVLIRNNYTNYSQYEILTSGDMVFFEMGETGAHQFFNHGTEPCIYPDIRKFICYDICEYPDSGKILIAPSYEIFNMEFQLSYFEGEKDVLEKWDSIRNKN